MTHQGRTVIFPANEQQFEPPVSDFPWNELAPDKSWQAVDGRTVVEYQISERPSWREAPLASFTNVAVQAGQNFRSEDADAAKLLQEAEIIFGNIATHIQKLNNPERIEAKIAALEDKKFSAEAHIKALGAVEADRSTVPKVTERLWKEAYQVVDEQMKPAAIKIAAMMLSIVTKDIEGRIKAVQVENKKLGFPVPGHSVILKGGALPSLCRLGAQIEAVADQLPSREHSWRVRNLLVLAEVVTAAAPVPGL
jgi:hypothetical protein